MAVAAMALLVALVFKVTQWARKVLTAFASKDPVERDQARQDSIMQVVAWVIGIGAAFLFAASDFADNIEVFEGFFLGAAQAATVVIFGMSIASTAGVGYDLVKGQHAKAGREYK